MALSDYLNLTWYGQAGKANYETPIDITSQVESLDKFTDVGTGETCSASVMLRAHGGNFVTEAAGAGDGTPIIKPFDLFKLRVEDDAGDSFERYLVQGRRSPQKTSMGQHITLDLHGREWWLQQITFPGRYYFRNFVEVVDEIIKFYNDWRAEKTGLKAYQPMLAKAADNLFSIPSYTYGIFEFGDTISCYDALMEVVRRLELPVAAGGGGQHYGLRFVDDSNDMDKMRIQIYGRGRDARPVDGTALKPISYTEVREPPGATVVVVEGQEGAGTVPPQVALFRGYIEEWNNLPEWNRTVAYPANAYVRHESRWYKARIASTNSEPQADNTTQWENVALRNYMEAHGEKGKDGSAISASNPYQYSPWTQDKATSGARNFMGKPDGVLGRLAACPDMNLVIRADVVDRGRGWRTWVDCRARGEGNIPARLRYGGDMTSAGLYHGLRILNDSSGPAAIDPAIPQTDKFGTSTANAVLVRDRDGEWIVFKTPETFNEVAVLNEGKVYEWNGENITIAAEPPRQHARTIHDARPASTARGSLAWRDIAGTLMGNDCFHYPSRIANATGLVPIPGRSDDQTGFAADSAIEIDYERNETAAASAAITSLVGKLFGAVGLGGAWDFFADSTRLLFNPDLTDAELDQLDVRDGNPDQYNDGWWAVLFEAPFPKSTYNGISEQVGQIYGGGQGALPKVPLFDAQNQTSTPTGKKGWTADDAEYLGQTSGIHFLFRFDIDGPAWLSIPGNIPHSAIVQDHLDNVWRARFAVRYQQITQPVYLPWSAFSIYRARLPVALTPAAYVQSVIKPELAVTETFDPRLIKRIIVQCDVGYDDEGRYDPWSWEAFIRKWVTAVPAGTIRYRGHYDAFCFVRGGLAVAKNDRVEAGTLPRIDKRISQPAISNAVQLRKIARAELDVAEHENDYISLKYERYCGVEAEQFMTIREPDGFIDSTNAETGSAPDGTLKMICKKVTYSVTGRAGAGGLIADVELFRKVANRRKGAITD